MSQASIGKKIRKHREMEEVSLEDLARRSGLDTDFVRSVEEDDVYPSLGPLLKIARGLGVRLGTFLDDTVVHDPLIVRQQDRQEELTMLKGKEKPASLRFYSLGKGKSDRKMEPFFIEVFPESAQEKKLSSHEGEEFIIVVSGQIELVYGHETHFLNSGDSVYYNSIVPHNVAAGGESPARIYAVLYFPE